MSADDPRVQRARVLVAFYGDPTGLIEPILAAYDDQKSIHRHTSEDLQAWRRRAGAAEGKLARVQALLDEAGRWRPYPTRDIGDAYLADTVTDFWGELCEAIDGEEVTE